VKKSASQYKALLATVRPPDLAGKTCRRMAAEELEDLQRLDVKLKAMKAELKAAVLATGSHLMEIHGIGPAGAARILADVGDITRFPRRGHFASPNGTDLHGSDARSAAPSTASSSPTPPPAWPHDSRRARESTPGRLYHPARSAFPPAPALRTSHFPDPRTRRYLHRKQP
jgi:hypothetical protein